MKKITFLLMLFLTSWSYSQQVNSYSFSQSTSTYTEITSGTVLGSTTNDDQRFVNPAALGGGTTATGVGLPIGFNFTFNGYVFDSFAVNSNGWISLGSSTLTPSVNINSTNSYTPISSTTTTAFSATLESLVSRIAALGKDLQGQTGSELSYETIGTAPNRTLVVQWKNYRKYGATGDSFNFQIRLNETTNVVDVVYGTFTSSNAANMNYNVGLRSAPYATAVNYTNRNGSTSWETTAPGFSNASAVLMSDTIVPSSGLKFSWTPETCLVATDLVTTDITTNSATISWTASSSSPTGYEYYVSSSDAYPTVAGTASTAETAAVSGLTQNTLYYVYVRTNCGTGFSAWAPMGTFKTLCTDTDFLVENFDSYATSAILPDCWTRGGTYTSLPYITTGGAAPGSAPNRLYMYASTSTNALAVLPSLSNLAASTHRLKFKAYSSTANKSIEVGYLAIAGDMSSFVVIETIVLPGTSAATAAEFIVVPTTVPAGVKFLAFKNNAQGATFYIDDVVWEPNPTCLDITALAGSMVTHNSVDLAWTATGTETEWQYAIGAASLNDATSLTPVDVTSSTITINGLTSSTSYKVWVRSKCSATDLGAWIGPIAFTTTCDLVTEFTENFDLATTFPACWSKVGTQGSAYPTSQTTAPSLPNALYIYSTSTTQAYVSMPPVSNSGAGTHRLKFKARGSVVGAVGEVGYLLDINNLNTFIPLVQFTTTSTTVYDDFVFELGQDPTTPYLAVRNFGTPSSSLYLDNFIWEPIPTCLDVTTVSVYNILDTTVDLAWVPGGSETAWQYAIGSATDIDPSTLTPVNVTASPAVSVSSLTPNTSYKVWIRSYCSATDAGAWVGPFNFKTSCSTVATFSEGFDLATSFPDCWNKVGTSGSLYPTSSTAAPTQPNHVYIYGSSATNQAVLSMQPVSNSGAGTHRLKFKARGSSSAGPSTLEVGFLLDYLDPTTFIPLQTLSIAYSSNVYTEYSVELGTDPTTPFIALRHPGTPTYSIYFDDVVWEPIPNCLDINTVSLYNVTSTSIDAAWVAGGSETAWDYVLGSSTDTDPTTLTPVAVPTSPALTISSLTPNTSYKIWIRSSCSATDKGAWVGPFTFKTACSSVTTFSQNFDIDTNFPDCWSKVGTNGSLYPSTSANAPSQPNYVYFYSSATAQGVLAMQPVSNLADGTHRLKFKARGSNSANPVNVEIGYLTNLADATTFVPIQQVAIAYNATASVFETYIVEPGVLTGVSANLAMRHTGFAASACYLDDIVWEPIPSVAPDCATGITAVPDANCGNFATQLSWTPVTGADGYYLTVGTTPGGSDVMNLQNIGSNPNYSFLGNHNTTYYYTLTPFNAIGNATACTEQSFVTAVNGCYCTSLPTSNDGNGITNVQIGTTNFPNGDVTYFDNTATPVSLQQAVIANVQIAFATGYTYGTNIWIDFNDNYTFETSELVYSGVSLSANPTTLDASFEMPLTAALGSHRMRIATADSGQATPNPCYSGSYGVTLDFTVVVTAPPACLPVTNVTIADVTSATASVSWTAPSPAPANGYDYYLATVATDPTDTTVATGSVAAGVTALSLTSLTPATMYYVWVRSVCSSTEVSPWSASVSFMTACVSASVPYTQDFESATVPALPMCTSILNAGTGNDWTTANAPGFGFTSKTLRYGYSSSNAADAWFFTQPVTLTAGTSYDISYKYGNNSTTYIEKMKVAYGTSASVAGMTTVIADHSSISGAVLTQNLVAFTPTVSGDYYFGFNAYSIANQYYLYVDDILIDATLSNNSFDASGFAYYPNPVKNVLNLSYTKTISNVEVFNLIGQQVIVKSLDTNQSQIDMSSLTQGTYIVKVTSDNQVKTIKVIKE